VDKRRSLRIAVNLPARFRSEVVSVDGRAANLSQSGMLFLGAPPALVTAGTVHPVNVEIDLPDIGTPISTTAEVRWIEPGEAKNDGAAVPGAVGLRFTGLAVGARRRLANLILRACAAL
jgi:hypothetical protein